MKVDKYVHKSGFLKRERTRAFKQRSDGRDEGTDR